MSYIDQKRFCLSSENAQTAKTKTGLSGLRSTSASFSIPIENDASDVSSDSRNVFVADIAVPLPVTGLFSYLVPGELKEKAKIGVRVRVPFKNREDRKSVV